MVIMMKRILFLLILCFPVSAFAVQGGVIVGPPIQLIKAPSTSCPSGYVAVEEDYVTIADSACPSGYTSAGVADSCLVASPAGACIMYAPANVAYSDRTGAYMFEYACPLSDDVSGGLPVIGGGQIVRPLQ